MNGYEKTETYRCKDFYLSCYLRSVGVPLVMVEKKGSIAYFCFQKSPEIKKIITGFYNGQDKVSANNLVNAIKDLKSAIPVAQADAVAKVAKALSSADAYWVSSWI